MWIFDSYYKGCVELWGKEHGLSRASIAYPHSFYLHLRDPSAHREMIAALECRYKTEECRFRTIFGALDGYRIYAGRDVAEKIEVQTGYAAELYNVDVRHDLRYMAEHDIFPCGDRDESRFSLSFEYPLSSLELRVAGDPYVPGEISRIEVLDGRSRKFEGPERGGHLRPPGAYPLQQSRSDPAPLRRYLGPSHSQKGETLWPGAHHQSHMLVQEDGPQVLLELRTGFAQG